MTYAPYVSSFVLVALAVGSVAVAATTAEPDRDFFPNTERRVAFVFGLLGCALSFIAGWQL